MVSATKKFLSGDRPPAAKFADVGDRAGGTIVRPPAEVPVTDYKTRRPVTWPSGDEKTQLLVVVRTDEIENFDDDGLRSIYIRPGNMRNALRQALQDGDVDDLAIGGKLSFTYVADEPIAGLNPAKIYECRYTPPPEQLVLDIESEGR